MVNDLIIPTKISELLAEETGLHIGDGTMNFYRQKNKIKGSYELRGHIIDDRPHYDTRIKEIYKELYNIKVPLKEMRKTGVFGFQIWSDSLVNFKSKILGLPLGPKKEISIPYQFLNKNHLKKAVIRGIYDTDGCLYIEKKRNQSLYPRIKFTTTSGILAKQIKKELVKLNIRATHYFHRRKEKNWNDLHSVEVRGEMMLIKFFSNIKPGNPKHIEKYESFLNNS